MGHETHIQIQCTSAYSFYKKLAWLFVSLILTEILIPLGFSMYKEKCDKRTHE